MERFDFSYAPYDSLSNYERQTLQAAVNIAFLTTTKPLFSRNNPLSIYM